MNKLQTWREEVEKEVEEYKKVLRPENVEKHLTDLIELLYKKLSDEDIRILELHVLNDKLATIKKATQYFEEIIDDVDLELIFTDVKDKEGNKIKESDDIMKLYTVFWQDVQEKLKQELKEAKKE